MRSGELAFLILLVCYHGFLLVPRHRRPFPANYLVFLAGMALAWNLGMEGLRWQTLPPTALLLVDLAVLFPSFATLRGRLPNRGFWSGTAQFLRSLVASVAFLMATGCALLAVAFPLPRVELTGGLPPAYRVIRFPATTSSPALDLRVWYPSSGDLHPRARPASEPETWQKAADQGGLPVFWQSYLEHLPTSLVRGGKTAAPGTRYPVIYVAAPQGEDPGDFGYLFEDLASRGFLVVAGVPVPPPRPASAPFSWSSALNDLLNPLLHPTVWLQPDLKLGRTEAPPDYSRLAATRDAIRQLDAEPGDVLFASVDMTRQGLWSWGYGAPFTERDDKALGLKGTFHAGGPPTPATSGSRELWLFAGQPLAKPQNGQWFLNTPRLERADVADSAYLRPFLAFFGLKSQADAGLHGAIRQYQAAFFQFAFWATGTDVSFRQTVPEVSGLVLSGK